MQIGIDSFAAAFDERSQARDPSQRLRDLIEEIEHADRVGLDVFGIGEHHRREFLDSAPTVILGAASIDGILGVLFLISYLKCRSASPRASYS